MNKTIKDITVKDAYDLIQNEPNLTIIDGRSIDMFREGHIANAIVIDAFANNVNKQLEQFNKTKPYLIYCTTNIRSEILVNHMADIGFKNLYLMYEGILGWQQHRLPIVKRSI